jgi:hypothetical protein
VTPSPGGAGGASSSGASTGGAQATPTTAPEVILPQPTSRPADVVLSDPEPPAAAPTRPPQRAVSQATLAPLPTDQPLSTPVRASSLGPDAPEPTLPRPQPTRGAAQPTPVVISTERPVPTLPSGTLSGDRATPRPQATSATSAGSGSGSTSNG